MAEILVCIFPGWQRMPSWILQVGSWATIAIIWTISICLPNVRHLGSPILDHQQSPLNGLYVPCENDLIWRDRDIVMITILCRLVKWLQNAYLCHLWGSCWALTVEWVVQCWHSTNLFSLFRIFTSVPLFVKTGQEMRVRGCKQTDSRQTHWHMQTQFHNLAHATL